MRSAILLAILVLIAFVAGPGCGSDSSDGSIDVAAGGDLHDTTSGKLDLTDADPVDQIGDLGVEDSQGDVTADQTIDAGCITTLAGVYAIGGSDPNGTYTGRLEIRPESGKLRYIRTLVYDKFSFESQRVASALVGEAELKDGKVVVGFGLERVGYLRRHKTETRDGMELSEPVQFSGTFESVGCNSYSGKITGTVDGTALTISESWARTGNNPTDPIWQNLRVEIPVHPEPTANEKLLLQQAFGSFVKLPRVSAYANRPDFQKIVHLMVVDKTDFEFYRDPQNKDVVRVIQQLVDPIGLAEALRRKNAYSMTLAQKEAHFKEDVQEWMIDSLGMVSARTPGTDIYIHNNDGLLWTGVYVAAMAKKYLLTNDAKTLERMLASLNGVIATIDIVPDKAEFGRTIRLIKNDNNPEFHTGSGTTTVNGIPYSLIQWKEGGNNDMAKGPLIAFLWSFQVLKEKPAHQATIKMMIKMLERMRDNSKVFGDYRQNQLVTDIVLLVMMNHFSTDYLSEKLTLGLEIEALWNVMKQYYEFDSTGIDLLDDFGLADQVQFINKFGISDWSGNHLTLWGLYNLYIGFGLLGDKDKRDKVTGYLRDGNQQMQYTRQGLFQLITGHLGTIKNPADIEDALWRLREVPVPRWGDYQIDHSINRHFSLSPIPALFWKNDWTTNDRTQSLRGYPLFEQAESSYFWKSNLMRHDGGGSKRNSGVDFLMAYWFGRYYKIISTDL